MVLQKGGNKMNKRLFVTQVSQKNHSSSLNFKRKGFFSRFVQYIIRPIKTAIKEAVKEYSFKKSLEIKKAYSSKNTYEQYSTTTKQQKSIHTIRLMQSAAKNNSRKMTITKELKSKTSFSR